MTKSRAKRIIQVPIEEDLLTRVDETAGIVAESRAEFIREACRLRLRSLEARQLDRRYVAAYRKKPEQPGWSRMAAKLLGAVLSRERW
jgi:metal-responsive CopG/Arc/MetJ family transcriptional regulator